MQEDDPKQGAEHPALGEAAGNRRVGGEGDTAGGPQAHAEAAPEEPRAQPAHSPGRDAEVSRLAEQASRADRVVCARNIEADKEGVTAFVLAGGEDAAEVRQEHVAGEARAEGVLFRGEPRPHLSKDAAQDDALQDLRC